jgi:UDP-N-acetyl-D-mannosaminuronate dehydrogenase
MTTAYEQLLSKINSGQAKVDVIGTGCVEFPLLVESAKAGYLTYGIDSVKCKAAAFNAGRSYVIDVPESNLTSLVFSAKQ